MTSCQSVTVRPDARARSKMRAFGCQMRLEYPHWHPMCRVFEIAIPASDGLVGGAPQRRPHRHRRELAVPALPRPRLAGHLVLLGQPGVEGAPEVDVAGAAAGGDEQPLEGADVDGAAVVDGGDPEHPPRGGALPDDARHLVPQQHLGALGARALLEGADEARADPGLVVRHPLARDGPLHGALLPAHLRGPRRPHEVVLELDAVLDEETRRVAAFSSAKARTRSRSL